MLTIIWVERVTHVVERRDEVVDLALFQSDLQSYRMIGNRGTMDLPSVRYLRPSVLQSRLRKMSWSS